MTKRRFFLDGKPDMHLDHFVVVGEGKLEDLAPAAPVAEGAELLARARRGRPARRLGRRRQGRGIRRLRRRGGRPRRQEGEGAHRARARRHRVRDARGEAGGKKPVEPLTAEGEAEKPTRKPPARKDAGAATGRPSRSDGELDDAEEPLVAEAEELESRGRRAEERDRTTRLRPPGCGRHRGGEEEDAARLARRQEPEEARVHVGGRRSRGRQARGRARCRGRSRRGGSRSTCRATISAATAPTPRQSACGARRAGRRAGGRVRAEPEAASENGAAPAKKKTRRGSRGGKNRRKRTAAARRDERRRARVGDRAGLREPGGAGGSRGAGGCGSDPRAGARARGGAGARAGRPCREAAADDADEDWGYVPMSEWGDDLR